MTPDTNSYTLGKPNLILVRLLLKDMFYHIIQLCLENASGFHRALVHRALQVFRVLRVFKA
jgi:hypothetical protein